MSKGEYTEEMPQSQITDQPMVKGGRDIRTQINKDTYILAKNTIKVWQTSMDVVEVYGAGMVVGVVAKYIIHFTGQILP